MNRLCILKRKALITSQRLSINVTCGSSSHCPDDNDSVDDCLHPIQRYDILKVTAIYIVLSLHQICDLVSMRHEKGIVPVLPTPTLLPLFKLC